MSRTESEKVIYSTDFKKKIMEEVSSTGNVGAVAKKYKIPPTTVYSWNYRKKTNKKLVKDKEHRNYKNELAEKDLEIKILKELLKKTTLTLIKD
jgi:transposase